MDGARQFQMLDMMGDVPLGQTAGLVLSEQTPFVLYRRHWDPRKLLPESRVNWIL